MSFRELDREFRAVADRRADDWVKRRALAYWVAALTRSKLPDFKRWIDPGIRGSNSPGQPRQTMDQMKAAMFQLAAATGTEVKQGDKVLIAAKPNQG